MLQNQYNVFLPMSSSLSSFSTSSTLSPVSNLVVTPYSTKINTNLDVLSIISPMYSENYNDLKNKAY